ncbi:FCSD flavin-binding domain-containing protein [Methylobrevis albus]|uniref:FAD-dependent oxidoreductase n=1 Tax=Methylobrevis albus TaxID=2793297 RepID=A0A931I197_9HYPH|nr:FCSD flavin-binding domain-containing protein [Methylobrevis albus]MBH0237559.1 FAD-dependent oxidoreductase [Methylobrevis albus]
MTIHRRDLLKALATGAATLAAPAVARGQARPRIVIVGGGAGGATLAVTLARAHPGAFDIVLIEQDERYVTCFFSNLYLGGLASFESLGHGYGGLAGLGIELVTERATSIDRDRRSVATPSRPAIAYDRLVVAPGVELDYASVPGYSAEAAELLPHAWKAGPQTRLLKAQLDAVEDGGTIVMLAPPNPFRCPPGPYERISMMAYALQQSGRSKARIVVLDAKEKFSKQALFMEGWQRHYPGMVEWLPPSVHGGIDHIDVNTRTVVADLDSFTGALVNVIPAQKAGITAQQAGLVDESGWCPVDAASMRSTLDAAVFVLGDASKAGDMPKSAFAASSQAKVAATAIAADLIGRPTIEPRYFNTCWSRITAEDCVKVGALYLPAEGKITTTADFVSQPGEPDAERAAAARESEAWYGAITAGMFAT